MMRTNEGHRPPKPADRIGALLEQLVPAQFDMNRHLERIHAELRSIKGVQINGSEPREITTGPNGQSMKLSTSAGQLTGYALRETSGSNPCVIRLRDGHGVNGGLMIPVALNPSESIREYFEGGISFADGLFVEVISGVFEGTVFLGPNP